MTRHNICANDIHLNLFYVLMIKVTINHFFIYPKLEQRTDAPLKQFLTISFMKDEWQYCCYFLNCYYLLLWNHSYSWEPIFVGN